MITPYFLAGTSEMCQMALGAVIAAAESLANPAATIIIGLIFKEMSRVISSEQTLTEFMHKVQIYTWCLLGITGYTAITSMLGYNLWMRVGYALGHKARVKLYRALIQRSTQWFDKSTNLHGKVMMHYKDIQDIEVAAGTASFEIVSMLVGCIVEIGVAFYFSWAVTLVCLAGIPLLMIIGTALSTPITKCISKSKAQLDVVSDAISWVLGALQTVKIFQQEPYEMRKINAGLGVLQRQNIHYHALFYLQEGLCRTIVLMIFMQGFYFGSYMVRHHGLNAGDVVTVFWSCLNAAALVQVLMSHLLEWNKGRASAERLAETIVFDEEVELMNSIGQAPDLFNSMYNHLEELGWKISQRTKNSAASMTPDSMEVSGHINFSHVEFKYPSRDDFVFKDLSMDIPAGTTVFILGQSGHGKSSIARLLSKQYSSFAGYITIDDHEIELLSNLWIEKNLYVCEQHPKLFDIPIRENIALGSTDPVAVSNDEIDVAIEDSCAEFIYYLRNGLKTCRCETLSGGQKQRIALARARLRNAPIMIFDECTSALDPTLQADVFNNILQYRRGKTTIIITHDVDIIPEGYPIYTLVDGKAIFQPSIDRPEKLNSTTHVVRAEFDEVQDYEAPPIARLRTDGIFTSLLLFRTIPSKCLFSLGMIISILHSAVNPVFSFIFSKLLLGIFDSQASKLTMWAMLVMTLAICDGILTFCRVTLAISAEQWLRSIRVKLLSQLIDRTVMKPEDAAYYNKLLTSDTEKVAEIITLYWPGITSMIALGIIGFVWSVVTGWKLTLVGVSPLPVFVCTNQLYKWLTKSWNRKREERRSAVVRLMMDLTSERGFCTLKMLHLEYYFRQFYLDREDQLMETMRPMLLELGTGYGILKCFPYALQSLLLWFGMRLLYWQQYEAQTMLTVFTLLVFTITTIDQLTGVVGSVGNGFEALERLLRSVSEDKSIPVNMMSGKPKWTSLDFYSVGVKHADGTSALTGFTEHISQGETVAIIGPSGAGKSTIARLLERLEAPTTGEIVVDKTWDLQAISTWDVRQNVALVGQAPLDFFDGTIAANLLYALVDYERMVEVCQACGADDFIAKLSDGYETRIKDGTLSGGQMQRLGIARALMRQPRVLVLDECTSALDEESKALVKSMIVGLKQRNMITIVITHQLDVADIADRVIQI